MDNVFFFEMEWPAQHFKKLLMNSKMAWILQVLSSGTMCFTWRVHSSILRICKLPKDGSKQLSVNAFMQLKAWVEPCPPPLKKKIKKRRRRRNAIPPPPFIFLTKSCKQLADGIRADTRRPARLCAMSFRAAVCLRIWRKGKQKGERPTATLSPRTAAVTLDRNLYKTRRLCISCSPDARNSYFFAH